MVEENAYQEFFKKALEKTGKSIPDMSDEEKKAFFNKIDSAWKGKGEKNEGNTFGAAVADAKKDGDDSFKVGGKEYKVESNEEDLDEEAVVVSKRTPEGNIVSKLKEENESINELANAETVDALTAIIGAGGVVGGALALDKLMTALEKGKMGSKGKAIAKTLRGLGKTFAGAGMKGESVNDDKWRNTIIQSKNIFRMLKQKYTNNIPKMEKGLETILKQNKTKNDQAEVVRQEFKKYFKIK